MDIFLEYWCRNSISAIDKITLNIFDFRASLQTIPELRQFSKQTSEPCLWYEYVLENISILKSNFNVKCII